MIRWLKRSKGTENENPTTDAVGLVCLDTYIPFHGLYQLRFIWCDNSSNMYGQFEVEFLYEPPICYG